MRLLTLAAETFPPPVTELFEFAPIFGEEGSLLAFNRVSMLFLLAGVITIGLMMAAFNSPRLVPGKLQAAMEGVVEFVREQIVLPVVGPAGLRYLPLCVTLFVFVFINNLFEITPLVQFPTTGRMALPAFMAIVVWTVFVLAGFRHQGLGYLRNIAVPPGVPWWLLPLITPIEIISTFLVRPFTLAIRLFANMMAGHILLSVIFVATNTFLLDFHGIYEGLSPVVGADGPLGILLGLVLVVAGAVAVAFELLVGALQAYIFTILTAVYLASSIHPEH